MNKVRRKALADLVEQFEVLKEELDSLMEVEEEYRDNMPENLQGSERYEKADAASDNLSDAVDNLEEAISSIKVVIGIE